MRNAEIHDLRGQVVEMDRLTNDLELAREKSKSLQAKTEDLQAQMEKRSMSERSVREHLVEGLKRMMEGKRTADGSTRALWNFVSICQLEKF